MNGSILKTYKERNNTELEGIEELDLPAESTVAKQREVVGITYISRTGLKKLFTMLGYLRKA